METKSTVTKDEIKLSDKFTLVSFNPNNKDDLTCDYDLSEMGGGIYLEFNWMEDCDGEGNPDGYSIEVGEGKLSDFTLLGTWEQFANSEDAEERAKKWIHEETGKYKHYGFSCWWKMNALDSLESAVKVIDGDIFIIREDKE